MDISELLNSEKTTTSAQCNICYRVFDGSNPKRTLTRHLRSVHEEKTACLFCSKKIKVKGRPDHYKGHLRRCSIFLYSVKDMTEDQQSKYFQTMLGRIQKQEIDGIQKSEIDTINKVNIEAQLNGRVVDELGG
eukprot:NODE_357_length_10221_cov_0.563130.p7 type:complete len:133 gc:universal NODE_357_length_10221_cov_0.563130:9774-9376(-)